MDRFRNTSDSATASHSAFASTTGSRILSIADASTADLSSFYSLIAIGAPSTASLSDSALEELVKLTATLEAKRLRIDADASQPTFDMVPEAMSSLSLEELELLAAEEGFKAAAAEEEYELLIANNIRQGIEEAKVSEKMMLVKRKQALQIEVGVRIQSHMLKTLAKTV